MKSPAEVIASFTGTDGECITHKLAAIREWLSTPDGQAYVAELSEPPGNPLWTGNFSQPADSFAEPVSI